MMTGSPDLPLDSRIERPRWKVRGGLPAYEIVEAAKEMDVDLIVLATRVYGLETFLHREHRGAGRACRSVSGARCSGKGTRILLGPTALHKE